MSEVGQERRVRFPMAAGIFFLPYIFAWFTLRKGYSTLARLGSFGWLAFVVVWLSMSISRGLPPNDVAKPSRTAQPAISSAKVPNVTKPKGAGHTAARAPLSNWRYSQERDDMRNIAVETATTSSTNRLDLGYPYGVEPGTLTLFQTKDSASTRYRVRLQVNGQFDLSSCGDYACTLQMKFDDGPIYPLELREAEGHPAGVLISDVGPQFIEMVKAASVLRLEAVYYQAGRRQLTFDVGGLTW